jgi:hypothetical protein
MTGGAPVRPRSSRNAAPLANTLVAILTFLCVVIGSWYIEASPYEHAHMGAYTILVGLAIGGIQWRWVAIRVVCLVAVLWLPCVFATTWFVWHTGTALLDHRSGDVALGRILRLVNLAAAVEAVVLGIVVTVFSVGRQRNAPEGVVGQQRVGGGRR